MMTIQRLAQEYLTELDGDAPFHSDGLEDVLIAGVGAGFDLDDDYRPRFIRLALMELAKPFPNADDIIDNPTSGDLLDWYGSHEDRPTYTLSGLDVVVEAARVEAAIAPNLYGVLFEGYTNEIKDVFELVKEELELQVRAAEGEKDAPL